MTIKEDELYIWPAGETVDFYFFVTKSVKRMYNVYGSHIKFMSSKTLFVRHDAFETWNTAKHLLSAPKDINKSRKDLFDCIFSATEIIFQRPR